MTKYFKPKSLSWWVSIVPLIAGIVLALADAIPELAGVAKVIQSMAGYDKTAAQLVQLGLLGIGLRGAVQ